MASPERLPIANRSRRTLMKTNTRGTLYDLLAYSSTRDIAKYSTDFMGGTIDGQLVTTGGNSGTVALGSTGESGTLTLTTGAGDNQTASIYLAGGNWVGNQNPVATCRIKLNSITAGNVQFGFCDNIGAGVLTSSGLGPFVSPLASPPTLVGSTASAVALTFDLSSALGTPAAWRLAYSRASTAAVTLGTSTAASITAPVLNTYQWLTIALERSPIGTPNMAVKAYVNEVLIASVTTGVISNTAALYPFLLVGSAVGSASVVMTCDYFEVHQDRDTSI